MSITASRRNGEILLPPSPNWFFINAMDGRAEDSLLVSAAFKSILVQHVAPEKKLPTLLKVIPNVPDKVVLVSLCPQASHPHYGHTVAAVCEGSLVRLFNLHTGHVITDHRQHERQSVNGISWGHVDEEEVVVTVGAGGRVVVWEPRHNAIHLHNLNYNEELTLVEVNPYDRSQALVAANKDIALVNLKSGSVISWLKGHNMSIYCMKWYEGEEYPWVDEDYPTNRRAEALRKDCTKTAEERKRSISAGPFFASSDHGRFIFLWDLSARRYIAKMNVPTSVAAYKKNTGGKDRQSKVKQHIPIAWHDKFLLSSTVHGELLLWTYHLGIWKYQLVHHLHYRVVYNLLVLGDVVVTSGQDRMLHGYHMVNKTHLFQLSTLGGFGTTLAFCPHDAKRLAFGTMDGAIRVMKFGSPTPLQTQTITNNIKGKILSLSWHPEKENHLLFGTAMGQVGWLDMSTSHLTSFAYFHQKSVYKVEWAPPVCTETSKISEPWCAYSFGDREIVMRLPYSPLADPLHLKNMVPDPENKKFPKDITEFAFSPDYTFLVVGLIDGHVLVYRRRDMEKVATVVVVKKAIQHLLWKPQGNSSHKYTLAVASNESSVHLLCLDDVLQGQENENAEEITVTQATRVLSGHEARVVWLSWSLHKPSLLASASYDNTVQLWDTEDGTLLGNYGGHGNRVFRVEFSPSDPDMLLSCGESSFLHSWRTSNLTCKTPAESIAVLKALHAKKKVKGAASEEEGVTSQNNRESSQASVENATKGSCSSEGTKGSSDSTRKVTFKTSFPKLHQVSARKKGFHHIIQLSLLAVKEAEEAANSTQQKGKTGDDSLEDDLEDLGDGVEEEEQVQEVDIRPIITSTVEKYGFLMEKGSAMPALDDFVYVMQMHGQPQQMDTLLSSEIEIHESKGNTSQASIMHSWRGSLGNHIHQAAKQKKLTPFLVASAPQVSMKLWETACEAYAEQLVGDGDIITAASYLLNIHKAEKAITVLMDHKYFKEALAIAKSRLGYDQEQLHKVVGRWVKTASIDGNPDLAATLQLGTGELKSAAHTLWCRTDPGSLFVSAMIYSALGDRPLAASTALTSLKEVCIRQEMDKVEDILNHLPELGWFRVLSTLHALFIRVTHVEDPSNHNYLIDTPESEAAGGRSLVEEVKVQWQSLGFSQDQYEYLYKCMTGEFSTHQTPLTLKHMWLLVSISLCKCLLSPTNALWDQYITDALKYVIKWGKHELPLRFTFALIPRGEQDLEVLKSTLPETGKEAVTLPGLQELWVYHTAAKNLHTNSVKESWGSEHHEDTHEASETEIEAHMTEDALQSCDRTST